MAKKRSAQVAAPLLAAAALSVMSGCRKPEMQRCVDQNNVVVDDSLCANQPQTNQQNQNMGGGGGGGYVPYRPMYHYYYGGSGGFGLGTPATGGSLDPVEGHSYVDSSGRASTVRGGFGRTMSSSGDGGEGHGGGAGE